MLKCFRSVVEIPDDDDEEDEHEIEEEEEEEEEEMEDGEYSEPMHGEDEEEDEDLASSSSQAMHHSPSSSSPSSSSRITPITWTSEPSTRGGNRGGLEIKLKMIFLAFKKKSWFFCRGQQRWLAPFYDLIAIQAANIWASFFSAEDFLCLIYNTYQVISR